MAFAATAAAVVGSGLVVSMAPRGAATATFLHDGRASNLPDAILAHDGRGLTAQNLYRQLSASDLKDLITHSREPEIAELGILVILLG